MSPVLVRSGSPTVVGINGKCPIEDMRARLALEAAGNLWWQWDAATDALSMSQAHAEFLGQAPASLDALCLWLHPDDLPVLRSEIAALAEGRERCRFRMRCLRPDGRLVHADLRGAAQRDPDGMLVGVIGLTFDVTAEVERDRELARLEHSLIDAIPGMVFRWHHRNDGTMGFEYVSARSEDLVGRAPADLVEDWRNIGVHPDDLPRLAEHLKDPAPDRTWSFEGRLIRKDGRTIHIRTVANPSEDGFGGRYYDGVMFDVTAETLHAREVERVRRRLRLLADAVPAPVSVLDREGRWLLGNSAHAEMLGLPEGSYVGRHVSSVPELEYEVMWPAFERALAGETTTVERRLAFSHCAPRDYEITFRPEMDEDGHVERVIAMSVDVTAYRQRERELVNERRKAERASRAKTSFLAAMSHDLRTPLNAIVGYADVMRLGMFGPLSERYQGYVEDIYASGCFLRDLVGDLLELSRLEGGEDDLNVEPVAAAVLVEETLTVLGHPQRLQVNVDDHTLVAADRRAAVQCLMNVCDNALKYGDGPVLMNVVSDETAVRFEVRDWGPGVDPEEIAFLTEPFWQAERRNPGIAKDGAGIGLAIVRRLIEAQSGGFSIDLPDGGGLLVTVELPRATDSPTA